MPGYSSYIATHATDAVRERLSQGGIKIIQSILRWPWRVDRPLHEYGVLVLALAIVLVLLMLVVWLVAPRAAHAGQALHPETAPLILFTVLAFVACTLDFGWDVPVLTWGNRHLALYPPLVLSLLWACEALMQRARRRKMRLPVFIIYETVLWALCGAIILRVIAVLQPTTFAA